MYRLMTQSGKWIGPAFNSYRAAFNYRAVNNLLGARIIG